MLCTQTRSFFGNLVFTMVLSVLWTLSFEMPFMILDGILFGRKSTPSKFTMHQGHQGVESGKNSDRLNAKQSSIVDDKNKYSSFVSRYSDAENTREKYTKRNGCDDAGHDVNEETEKDSAYIYAASLDNIRDTRSNGISDEEEISYRNLYHYVDERPKVIGKESTDDESIIEYQRRTSSNNHEIQN